MRGLLKRISDFLRHRKTTFTEEREVEQITDFSAPIKGIVSAASVQKVRCEIERSARQERVSEINKRRVTKFSHSEHFKRRQPTTARSLWKPGVRPEEEEDKA